MADHTTYDVIVIGGGGAGLAAAIEAARAGAQVLLLDKGAALKGSTGQSVGSVSAWGTPEQRRMGIDDNPDDYFEDLLKFGKAHAGRESPELARVLVDDLPAMVAWLKDAGLHFAGPFLEPPHRRPRLLVALPNSMAYIVRLEKRARALGVTIRLSTPATSLTRHAGRITGVEARHGSQTTVFTARKGVVLAGGDFSNSTAFKTQYHSARYASYPVLNQANTGDAIRMGVEAGGVVVNGPMLFPPNLRFDKANERSWLASIPPIPLLTRAMAALWRVLPHGLSRPLSLKFAAVAMAPDLSLFSHGALAVNRQGENCLETGVPVGESIATKAPDGAYIIFDQTVAERFSAWPHFVSTAPGLGFAYVQDYRRAGHVHHAAPTLRELGAKLGVPAGALDHTVAAHNDMIDGGQDMRPLTRGPFVALGPLTARVVLTDAGLKVSTGMTVLDAASQPIPGLFAAGSTGQGGTLLMGHGHHLGWAFTSGRIAGRNAARGETDGRADLHNRTSP